MRNFLVLSAAASVLALGITTHQAVAFLPSANAISPGGLLQKIQKSDEKGASTRGQDGAGKAAQPAGRDSSAKGSGAEDKGQGRSAAQNKGDRTGQMRSGDKETRGAQRRTNVDVNVNTGRRGYRAERHTRVDVDADRRRRSHGRDVDVNVRGYGYSSGNCEEILRRYRQCRAR